MSVLANSNAVSTTSAYTVSNSLRFRGSASAYLNRTPASAGNRQKWTYSFWYKIGSQLGSDNVFGAYTNATNTDYIYFGGGSLVYESFVGSATASLSASTVAVFRDPSAWYHFVLVLDTTQATGSNRFKVYVNGIQQTLSFSTTPTLNASLNINNNIANYIGRILSNGNSTYYSDQYMTEINFIDGQALTPSSFGATDATTGVWQPAKYTGTYGTNGFYLPFTDNSALTTSSNVGLGKDFSGNSNYWVTNNISITAGTTYDSMKDVPTLTSATVANYAVINPINSNATISGGNLNVTYAVSGQTKNIATMSFTQKAYFEVTFNGQTGTNNLYLGVGSQPSVNNYNSASQLGYDSFAWSVGTNNVGVYKYNNNSGTQLSVGASSAGDVFMVAIDPPNGKIWFGKNGTWYGSGDPVAGTNAAYTNLASEVFPIIDVNGTSGSQTVNANFGQRPFAYTPPTGYVALNTYNLPTPTILQGNKYMDATLYTGTGATQSITNAGSFKPDLVWIKDRSFARNNKLTDSVRGVTLGLVSNNASTESIDTDGLTAFNSNGFTVGISAIYNTSTETYVGWQWQAGQGTTSTNTQGTITSTVSVNPNSGFSIITYTGTQANGTIGHGLGVAPKFIICKSRTTAQSWGAWNTANTAGYHTNLNTTSAQYLETTFFNGSVPSSTVISVGANTDINTSGASYVLYAWAPIAGFSAFGSYTGNGSTDGPFVYLGFRARYIMIKNLNAIADWYIIDTARNPYNAPTVALYADDPTAEVSSTWWDIYSNGFKLRNSASSINGNTNTIIYAAFAENPFKNALAR